MVGWGFQEDWVEVSSVLVEEEIVLGEDLMVVGSQLEEDLAVVGLALEEDLAVVGSQLEEDWLEVGSVVVEGFVLREEDFV